MASKNADKQAIKRKLEDSIAYCDSHHRPVQQLFESIVDHLITASTCKYDAVARSHEMKSLFPILSARQTRGMVPSIPMRDSSLNLSADEFLELWLRKWVGKYVKAWEILPSERCANQKGTVTDEALVKMVESPYHAGSEALAYEWATHHNLFMSAENIGGNLLEEYIGQKVASYGWIWCRGTILTAIDFCHRDCVHMFQVKNKTNTENSSGKGFREYRGAEVWHRMKAERQDGRIVTYWPDLVALLRGPGGLTQNIADDLLSERDYLEFVAKVASKNPDLITGDEG
ncbi:hypothetical protein J2S71_000648 [Olsenella profusa DSM 13989]|uniref:SinI family restriction endonuclease n=1 Tax=Olsenella profusa TaxID=138595 RepID=UPI002788F2F7|nr:SinI family restriction endonuclease [Olsenella profusa]MDP9858952.1 hypothetical protein [Olsenella profusa DSM 13989]